MEVIQLISDLCEIMANAAESAAIFIEKPVCCAGNDDDYFEVLRIISENSAKGLHARCQHAMETFEAIGQSGEDDGDLFLVLRHRGCYVI